jgi:hypothetical protein
VTHRRRGRQGLVDAVQLIAEQHRTRLALADVDVADVRAGQRDRATHVRAGFVEASEVQQELRHVGVQPRPAGPLDAVLSGPSQSSCRHLEGVVGATDGEQDVTLVDIQPATVEQSMLGSDASCLGELRKTPVGLAERCADDPLRDERLQQRAVCLRLLRDLHGLLDRRGGVLDARFEREGVGVGAEQARTLGRRLGGHQRDAALVGRERAGLPGEVQRPSHPHPRARRCERCAGLVDLLESLPGVPFGVVRIVAVQGRCRREQ